MDKVFELLRNERVSSLAIMGGTFDPIHFGHLAAALEVKVRYGLKKIVFMPSGNPPHKKVSNVSAAEHRYMMVRTAIADTPDFLVSKMEIDREGKTYTVDTMRKVRKYLGYEVELYFITGADAVFELNTWKDPGGLLSCCKVLSVTRPGFDKMIFKEKIAELNGIYDGRIEMVEIPSVNISSTDIREKVAKGLSIGHMVPQSVELYISANHLYTARG